METRLPEEPPEFFGAIAKANGASMTALAAGLTWRPSAAASAAKPEL
jgi:hypothetical protein